MALGPEGFDIRKYEGVPLEWRRLLKDCADRRRHGGLVRWHPDTAEPCPTCARRWREFQSAEISAIYLIDPVSVRMSFANPILAHTLRKLEEMDP